MGVSLIMYRIRSGFKNHNIDFLTAMLWFWNPDLIQYIITGMSIDFENFLKIDALSESEIGTVKDRYSYWVSGADDGVGTIVLSNLSVRVPVGFDCFVCTGAVQVRTE